MVAHNIGPASRQCSSIKASKIPVQTSTTCKSNVMAQQMATGTADSTHDDDRQVQVGLSVPVSKGRAYYAWSDTAAQLASVGPKRHR